MQAVAERVVELLLLSSHPLGELLLKLCAFLLQLLEVLLCSLSLVLRGESALLHLLLEV